uniref:(northern house mosquito) hypothetical protein n=1 Tax=Culex pipiens TaxID=7175 RepID=A0A8D8E1E0_CULPI
MVPLTFFPIVGGFYACLHIFGVLTGIWQLVADLVEEPTTLDVVFTVESIVSFIAHVFLLVGILKLQPFSGKRQICQSIQSIFPGVCRSTLRADHYRCFTHSQPAGLFLVGDSFV